MLEIYCTGLFECLLMVDCCVCVCVRVNCIYTEHKMLQSAEGFRDLIKYQQVVMNEWMVMDQRLDKLKGEVAGVKMKVAHVEEEIAGAKEDITDLREAKGR